MTVGWVQNDHLIQSAPTYTLPAVNVLASWLKRRSAAEIVEGIRRQRVADFIVDYRTLCEDIGPWQYAADLGAHPEAELRHVAYLAVWRDGPTLRVWEDVVALDAVDLVVDAAAEGFAAFVDSESPV